MTPPTLAHIVKKCLAKDPDDRWQSASDLKSELQWVLDSGSSAGLPAPVVETRRRNASLGWILAAIFAALLAAFAISHPSARRDLLGRRRFPLYLSRRFANHLWGNQTRRLAQPLDSGDGLGPCATGSTNRR